MLIRLVCLLALSSLCLTSTLDQFDEELNKKGLDVDKIHEELKRASAEVEEEFAEKGTQDELTDLRAAYCIPSNITNEVENETDINEELSEDLFEGDIILTPEQWAQVFDRDANATRQRRHAITDVTKMWTPMGEPDIPYSFAHGFPSKNMKIVTDSLEFWESRTCISFRPANETDKNFIEFNHNSKTCSSSLGMVGGKQQLNLGPQCFNLRVITHELSHAFGTMHIQSRADRDDYITVIRDNVKAGKMPQFAKDPLQLGERGTYNIPYEFGSILHYSENAFAMDRTQPTISAKEDYTKYQHSMQSPLASFYDVLLINRMYKCTDKCTNQILCENNGVQHGNDCNRCYCPKGWAGPLCQERPDDANVFNLTGRETLIIEVDGAPRRGYSEKLYVIEAPDGKRISASIMWMEDYPRCSLFKFFEIIPTNDTRINGIRFCNKPITTTIESESNQMLVWMYNRAAQKMCSQISFTPI